MKFWQLNMEETEFDLQGDEILLSSSPGFFEHDILSECLRRDFSKTFGLFTYLIENMILHGKVIQGLFMDFSAFAVKQSFENFLSQIGISQADRDFIYYANVSEFSSASNEQIALAKRVIESDYGEAFIIKHITVMLQSARYQNGTPVFDLKDPDPTQLTPYTWSDHMWAYANGINYGIYDDLYLQLYGFVLSHIEQKYKFTVEELYKTICGSVASDLSALCLVGKPIRLDIPPITSLVLNRVNRPTEIGEVVLELRHKMKPARMALRNLRECCQSEDTSIRESIDALRHYRYIMSELSKSYGAVPISMSVWSDLLEFLPKDLSDALDKADFEPRKLIQSFINSKAKELVRNVKLRHFDFLFSMKKEVLDIISHGRLVNKVFGYSPTEEDWQQLQFAYPKV